MNAGAAGRAGERARARLRSQWMHAKDATIRCLALVALAGSAAGCSTAVGRYGENRLLDVADLVSVSIAGGYGAAAEIRITPYLGLGAGWANDWRVGLAEQRWGPIWWEKERGIPIFRYYRIEHYRDFTPRWPGGDPYWWKETHRARASSLVFFPGMTREGELWWPIYPPYFITTPWEWPEWSKWNLLNAEAGLFVGVAGARLGISPLQLFDLVAGIITWDPANDDVVLEPSQWPDPAAPPTFPEPSTEESNGSSR